MITAQLTDTPYQFVQRLSPIEVELAYGDIHERWLEVPTPKLHHSRYRIIVKGRTYCFAGQLNKAAAALGRKGGKAHSEAKATAARANGAKGGRPRKRR